MKTILLPELRKAAKSRPAEYLEHAMRLGRVEGETLLLQDEDYALLRRTYPGRAPQCSQDAQTVSGSLRVACSDTLKPQNHMEAEARAFYIKEIAGLPANCSNCERGAIANKTRTLLRGLLEDTPDAALTPCKVCACEKCLEFC